MSSAVQSHTGLNATVRSTLWTEPPCRARWPAVCARPAAGVGQQSAAIAAARALSSMIRRPRDSWARIPQSSPSP